MSQRLARIEVWYSVEFACWYVAQYDQSENQIGSAEDFYEKSRAVSYAKSLMPKINISNRKTATL